MFMQFVETINDPEAIAAQQAADNEFYAHAIREMVALGLDMGRIIHQQVVAQAIDRPHSPIDEQCTADYDRVFRAMRRGVLLAKRLQQPPTPPRSQPQPQPQPQPEPRPRQPTEPSRPERACTDKQDRLDKAEQAEELDARPIPELLDEIRKDLGLPPQPSKAQPASGLHHPENQHDRRADKPLRHPPPQQPHPENETVGYSPLWDCTTSSTRQHPSSPPGTANQAENIARIAPSRCGNDIQDTTNPTPAEGPPYPPGS
jgi:hypothetical protein